MNVKKLFATKTLRHEEVKRTQINADLLDLPDNLRNLRKSASHIRSTLYALRYTIYPTT